MVSIKLILALAIGVVIIAISIVIFFFFRGGVGRSAYISESELFNGTSVVMSEKQMIKFDLKEEKHNLIVDAILNTSINITLQSTIIKTRINVGQTRRFDLDDDEKEDLSIMLNNITEGKANLSFKKICFENWTCGNWTGCINHNQTRICTDSGNCGAEENKPEDTQECFPTCSSQNGTLCSEAQTCNGNTTGASDGTCCIGKCKTKPIVIIDCGTNIDCLIDASKTCSIANLTHTLSSANATWEQTKVDYYKIKEFEDEKCKLYKEILSVTGQFTSSKRQSLEGEGKTAGEIEMLEEGIENSIANDLVGNAGSCRFSVYALEERLTELKKGNPLITTEELETYECTGEFI